jgi:hypothetical protein
MEGIKLKVRKKLMKRGGNKTDVGKKASEERNQVGRQLSTWKRKNIMAWRKHNGMKGKVHGKRKKILGWRKEDTKARNDDTVGIGEEYNWWKVEDIGAKRKDTRAGKVFARARDVCDVVGMCKLE